MTTTFEKYYSAYLQLKNIEDSIKVSQASYKKALSDASASISQKEQAFENDLKQLSEIETILDRYAEMASKYASAGDQLCTPKNPDMNQLKQYYNILRIGNYPLEKRRTTAQSLLYDSLCAKMFIEQKKEAARADFLQKQEAIRGAGYIAESKEKLEELRHIIEHELYPKMTNLLKKAALMLTKYDIDPQRVYSPSIPESLPCEMCFGYVSLPYTDSEKETGYAGDPSQFRNNCCSLIPFSIPGDGQCDDGMYDARTLHIRYNDQTNDHIHKIIQSIVFNILRNYPPLTGRITYIDYATFNDEFLQSMRCFTKDNSLIQFPHHANQVTSCLSKLIASSSSEAENLRQRRFLIIKDAGNQNQEMIAQIANNASKSNITIIYITNSAETTYINQRAGHVNIISKQSQFYLALPEAEYVFQWFSAPSGLDENSIQTFQEKLIPKKVSNEYENFFPLGEHTTYIRDRRPIVLPYGMDSKGNILNMTLEGMQFASFIMGASGSGKSTLLHALIAGIIRNYHPDEVELWLADLKLMEFANYTHHRPPHVKYILMDSSKEMVHDFIDLLHGEMERRQALLAAYGTNDCKKLPKEKYMPALVVIIDEFSTLSEVIRDDDTYKRKLEQILVRGRGPGLRLIFSSQSYTDGAPGLTKLARKQIQTRIAMKNSSEEIKMTLAIPSSEMTDTIIHDIDTLPEHYALHCIQEKSGLHRVEKAHGLYFNGQDEDGWKSRFELIDYLNKTMRPVPLSHFDPYKINQYVEKKPIIVSSKSLQAFNDKTFNREVNVYTQEPDNIVFEEDVLVRFGQPRKLASNVFTVITEENAENIFLLAGNKEITCGMSVIMSAIRSFQYHGGNIQFWAHPRNRTYHFYKDSHLSTYPLYVDIASIQNAIDDLRIQIQSKKKGRSLIVLLGMDSICADLNDSTDDGFSVRFIPSHESVFPAHVTETFPIVTQVPAEQKKDTTDLENLINDSLNEQEELYDKFYDEQSALGKSDEEIDEAFDVFFAEYTRKKYGIRITTPTYDDAKTPESPNIITKQPSKNYMKDFQQLIRVGSRYGYHFLVCVSNLQALKTMGLNINMFNHRLSFKTDSTDTSAAIFNNNTSAYRLPEHTCYYGAYGTNSGNYSITPYLHSGITWNNWIVDEDGIGRDGSRL